MNFIDIPQKRICPVKRFELKDVGDGTNRITSQMVTPTRKHSKNAEAFKDLKNSDLTHGGHLRTRSMKFFNDT